MRWIDRRSPRRDLEQPAPRPGAPFNWWPLARGLALWIAMFGGAYVLGTLVVGPMIVRAAGLQPRLMLIAPTSTSPSGHAAAGYSADSALVASAVKSRTDTRAAAKRGYNAVSADSSVDSSKHGRRTRRRHHRIANRDGSGDPSESRRLHRHRRESGDSPAADNNEAPRAAPTDDGADRGTPIDN